MADKNLNDFFDDELEKQQETSRQSNEGQWTYSDEEKRQSMYQGIPEYDNQQKFISRHSKLKTVLAIVLCVIALVTTFIMGYCAYLLINPDMKFISDVMDLVDEYGYVWDESDDAYAYDYAYLAAKAILSSIDEYSTLLTPEEYYELMYGESTTSTGATNGITYAVDDSGYYIYYVDIGSPGYEAGLFAGDVVVSLTVYGNTEGIDDGSTLEVTPFTSTETFKSYIHSQTINFVLQRNGETVTINNVGTSSSYESALVEYYFDENATNMSAAYMERIDAANLPSNVGYIRLTTFSYTSAVQEMAKAMALFKESGKTKLIFDLCDNTGGRSDVAAEIASYLVWDQDNSSGSGIVISVSKDKNDDVISSQTTDSVYDSYFDISSSSPQIVILTNGTTASASEMLLGAALDYGTVVQVGTTTYGKGIAQAVITLKSAEITVNGQTVTSYWAAYMTYAKFYTPISGVCNHGIGFTPEEGNIAETYTDMIIRALAILA